MIGMHVIMVYGFYKYFHGVREQRYVSSSKRLPSCLRSIRENELQLEPDANLLVEEISEFNG